MEKRQVWDVVVIGGGAAGLCAGLASAERGASTMILEHLDIAGKKILATGNGRCNLSNMDLTSSHYFGRSARFTEPVLALWTARQMRQFWSELGLATRTEEGRIYPYSLQAKSVLQVLLSSSVQAACRVASSTHVESVKQSHSITLPDERKRQPGLFEIQSSNQKRYLARRLILATGGKAAPALGSDGSGYELAIKLGHRMVPARPALVQLLLEKAPRRLSGLRARVSLTTLDVKNRKVKEEGELLFTDYGLSGICVLNISAFVSDYLERHAEASVIIDFLPDLSAEDALIYVKALQRRQPLSSAAYWAVGILPEKLSIYLFEQKFYPLATVQGKKPRQLSELAMDAKIGQMDDEFLLRLVQMAKAWPCQVSGTKGFGLAQITAGGLRCNEFNPCTMESLICPGLYAAGEVLDVQGFCGGYNLHWAFASGTTAGQQAALSLLQSGETKR